MAFHLPWHAALPDFSFHGLIDFFGKLASGYIFVILHQETWFMLWGHFYFSVLLSCLKWCLCIHHEHHCFTGLQKEKMSTTAGCLTLYKHSSDPQPFWLLNIVLQPLATNPVMLSSRHSRALPLWSPLLSCTLLLSAHHNTLLKS
jgi:hypothetical protein